MEAARNAIEAGENVNADDLKKFYEVLQSANYEEAQGKVVAMCEAGELTEGVVEAALKALEQCKQLGQEPELEATLQATVGLLMSALQESMSTPAIAIVEELAAMKPSENRPLVTQRLKLEFAGEGGVGKDEFLNCMSSFFEQMDEQDKEFDAQVKAVWDEMSEEEKAQIKPVQDQRKDARQSMVTILDIAKEC